MPHMISDEHVEFLKERCSYLKYGFCRTLACLRRCGYPEATNSPTCIEKELAEFIEDHRQTGKSPTTSTD